jgi:hypothetical protein
MGQKSNGGTPLAEMKFPEQYRDHDYTKPGDPAGIFMVPGRDAQGRRLKIIASAGLGWEHVSVTLPDWGPKTPSWAEMCFVKDLFWCEDETVIQFHPGKSDYVNIHPGCLHLWRPINVEIQLPPTYLV